MSELAEFVILHTNRNACRCGECIDAEPDQGKILTGETVDMVFYDVSVREYHGNLPEKEKFVELTKKHKRNVVLDPFDGKEHGFIEFGGWLGDQQIALRYMALGVLLGVFRLLSPITVLGDKIDKDVAITLAKRGYMTIDCHVEKSAVELPSAHGQAGKTTF